MQFDVVTLFPEFIRAFKENGVTGRAIKHGLLEVNTWNPRDFTVDKHRTVDDRPYGGGPGMLMKVQPLRDTLTAIKTQLASSRYGEGSGQARKIIYLSPQGKTLTQAAAKALSSEPGLIVIAGRYEGIDERLIIAEVDEEWSIGDYILSGGELPAMVLIDAVARLIPGVLGHTESAQQDSFVNGLLDYPHYTRPEQIDGREVPQVLLSGDHAAIARWRKKQALGKTWQRRPDLLDKLQLSDEEQLLLNEFLQETHTKN